MHNSSLQSHELIIIWILVTRAALFPVLKSRIFRNYIILGYESERLLRCHIDQYLQLTVPKYQLIQFKPASEVHHQSYSGEAGSE